MLIPLTETRVALVRSSRSGRRVVSHLVFANVSEHPKSAITSNSVVSIGEI